MTSVSASSITHHLGQNKLSSHITEPLDSCLWYQNVLCNLFNMKSDKKMQLV
jgi:hypothetical protein